MAQRDEDFERVLVETRGQIIVPDVLRRMQELGYTGLSDRDAIVAYDRLQKCIDGCSAAMPAADPGAGLRRPDSCPNCRNKHPVFVYTIDQPNPGAGEYAWNVTAAIDLVRKTPRLSTYIPVFAVRGVVERNTPDPAHYEHVDPAIPGLAIPFHGLNIIIDGNHRAGRCLRDGLPFYVFFLTQEETDACQLWSPTRPISDLVRRAGTIRL